MTTIRFEEVSRFQPKLRRKPLSVTDARQGGGVRWKTAACPHCQTMLSFRPLSRLREVSCPACGRQVFRGERVWGRLWTLLCVLCALNVGVHLYLLTDKILRAWLIYLVYFVPIAILAVFIPLRNLLMYFAHKVKENW